VNYLTSRLDYNVTEKHHVEIVYNYNPFDSVPDFTNNIVPVYPGTGTVLGSDAASGAEQHPVLRRGGLAFGAYAPADQRTSRGSERRHDAFLAAIVPGVLRRLPRLQPDLQLRFGNHDYVQ
jgi:hypothetical protein